MSYEATLREHRRLSILIYLAAAPGYAANASILQDVLTGLGLSATSDQVAAELAWLGEQDLVRLSGGPSLPVATATLRGIEVAQGLAQHPGVRRPRPGR